MAVLPPTEPPAPRGERRLHLSLPQILTLLVGGLILSVLAIHLEEGWRGHAAWRRYESDAKRRGVKLEMADYLPANVPDADNFASIPIFEAAFRASGGGQLAPNPFALPSAATGERPKLSDSNKQLRIDLSAWRAFFVNNELLPATSGNAAADTLQALARYSTPLTQLREASLRPHCRFPVHWENAFSAELPQMTLLQDSGTLYALRLAAHLQMGESAAAYEDFQDGLRLVTVTREDPILIPGVVRIANAARMENEVWGGLSAHQWTELDLRKIDADLATLDWLKDYHFAMGSERGEFNALADMLVKKPRMLFSSGRSGNSGLVSSLSTQSMLLLLYPTGWFYQSKVRAGNYFDEVLARVDPEKRRWFSERPVPSSFANIQSTAGKLYFMLLGTAEPVYETIETKYLHIAAQTDQTRLACALERFRLTRGSFPNSLTELSPEFMSAIPVEIVNGEPYHYRRTDDGSFVLYSVGTDLRDDGGTLDPKLSASKQRDWVWQFPAKTKSP